MWICLNDGFFSVVRDMDRPDGLMVRSRRWDHIGRAFPTQSILTTPYADYRWRTFMHQDVFADFMVKRIRTINYFNFKDSVGERRLGDLYADFWQLHWRYQDASPPD
jgi:hypothetical protein